MGRGVRVLGTLRKRPDVPNAQAFRQKNEQEIWPQRPRYFAAAIIMHYARGGAGSLSVGWGGKWHISGVEGGKPKVSSSLNHGLLQYYFAPYSKAVNNKQPTDRPRQTEIDR